MQRPKTTGQTIHVDPPGAASRISVPMSRWWARLKSGYARTDHESMAFSKATLPKGLMYGKDDTLAHWKIIEHGFDRFGHAKACFCLRYCIWVNLNWIKVKRRRGKEMKKLAFIGLISVSLIGMEAAGSIAIDSTNSSDGQSSINLNVNIKS